MSYERLADASQDPGDYDTVATLQDTCTMIDTLCCETHIPPPLQPPVELHHFSIAYWPISDQSFENPASTTITFSELNNEIDIQKKVTKFLEEAQEHSKNLYTWRSLMRLFSIGRPNLSDKSETSKQAIMDCLAVMEPEIKKVTDLYRFHKEACSFLATEIHKIAESILDKSNKSFYSQTCLVTMGKMLGAFTALDNLICFNSAVKNDFAEYNRTLIKARNAGLSSGFSHDEKEKGEMTMFFAQKTAIQDKLFDDLRRKDQSSGKVVAFFKKIIITCADNFIKNKYILPSEREEYLKIISCCLKFILVAENSSETKSQVFKRCFNDDERKMVKNCFKTTSVLKDFGDVPIDEKQLLVDLTGKGSDAQSSIHKQLDGFHAEHGIVVSKIVELVRHYNLCMETMTHRSGNELELEEYLNSIAKIWYDVCIRALKCLGSITGSVLSLYVWKLCNGSSNEDPFITNYSKVTEYNYNAEEKTDLTIAIGLAKGLQNVLLRYEDIFSFLIGRHCFSRLHDLCNRTIPEVMAKMKNKDRMEVKMYVDCLIRVAKKFKNPYDKTMPKVADKKAAKGGDIHYEASATASIGPGNTQLYMIRSILEWLCTSPHIKLYKKSSELCSALMAFHEESFYWAYVLNLSSVIPKTGDLSMMWFRESYLTMENSKVDRNPQFGLKESMPWILAEHLLKSDAGGASLIDYCLIPFELYNDSAEAVLKFFRKQHLFDELEAEASLGFEQLVHWLYTNVFENAVARALFEYAINKAPQNMKNKKNENLETPRKLNCKWLLQQSDIVMLGQTINLQKRMISQFCECFNDEISSIFAVFRSQSSSFAYVWEANTKLDILRFAHSLLSEDIDLPDFDTLVFEAKATVFNKANYKLHHVIIKKLESSFFPMYNMDLGSGTAYLNHSLWDSLNSYISEYSEKVTVPVPEYKMSTKIFRMNTADDYVEELFKVVAKFFEANFYTVTDEHYRALLKLVTLEELSLIVKECSRVLLAHFSQKEVKNMFGSQPIPSVLFTLLQLRPGMNPTVCKLKPSNTSSYAQVVDIHETFCPIILYRDFDFLVQGLTEMGNILIFLYQLDKAVKTEDARTCVASAMFTNRFSHNKFIQLIGRGRFLEVRNLQMANESSMEMTPEAVKHIEKQASESTTAYVGLKMQLMERSNIFRYVDPQSKTAQLLMQTLKVPEKTTSFFCKVLLDLQNIVHNNPLMNFFDVLSEQPSLGASQARDHLDPLISRQDEIQFHWLWSAITFGMAKPQTGGGAFTENVKSQYSDGATLIGCAIISLLGQFNRFQCFDLCTFLKFIVEAENIDKRQKTAVGNWETFDLDKNGVDINIRTYLKRILQMQRLSEAHFEFIQSMMKVSGIDQVRYSSSKNHNPILQMN